MKENTKIRFEEWVQAQSSEDQALLSDFFADFDSHCLLSKLEKQKMRQDFENAILYYLASGVTLEQALTRLDPSQLGGFYARPPILWFPLDDAAKVYPLSMKPGLMPMFRLAVYLKEQVVPELLQMALHFTIKRFPSFATTLKKGFFWHYLDTAKRRFCVEQEKDIPCRPLKIAHSGSQSFRVQYYGNRISVEFFHVLTDATGGMVFLKVLTGVYLQLTGVNAEPDETLWDVHKTPGIEEFANQFSSVPRSSHSSGFVDKPAVQMSGPLARQNPCRILHFKMDAAALKKAAAGYQATVTAYLLSLMFLAARAATEELSGELSIQVPVNMRKFYPSSTVRNFSLYCGIRLPVEKIREIPWMIEEISRQLHVKASKEAMSEMLTSAEQMVDALKFVPLGIKQPVAKVVYGFLSDRIFSDTLSNIGVVKMPPAYEEHIESMDFILGPPITNRACSGLVTFGNTATLSVTKATVDPTYEETLYRILVSEGIPVKVEGSELYEG